MKGIIVAAGYGTRFLPVTKTLPKEMLPLIDKPAIAFIMEEFLASGIKDIIIITNRRKAVMDAFFDREPELEAVFTKDGAQAKLSAIKPYDANICFVRQQAMNGSGHALLLAAPWLGGESAVVAYPDDVHFGDIPLAKQLIIAHEKSGKCICAAFHEPGPVNRYGVFALDATGKNATDFIEKPALGEEPSHEVSIGRYLFTAEYFKALSEGLQYHDSNLKEYPHVYGLKKMIERNSLEVVNYSGLRVDTGEPTGYLEAILSYTQSKSEYQAILTKFSSDFLAKN